jgi:hypothetical protein
LPLMLPESRGVGARPATLASRSTVSNARRSPPTFARNVAASWQRPRPSPLRGQDGVVRAGHERHESPRSPTGRRRLSEVATPVPRSATRCDGSGGTGHAGPTRCRSRPLPRSRRARSRPQSSGRDRGESRRRDRAGRERRSESTRPLPAPRCRPVKQHPAAPVNALCRFLTRACAARAKSRARADR